MGNVNLIYFMAAAIIGYAFGCFNIALYFFKKNKIDYKGGKGTGNLGTSNVLLLVGKKEAALTLLCDFTKGVLPMLFIILLSKFMPALQMSSVHSYAAGAFAILGHMFPFYLKFKGGKGFATYLGVALIINWRLALLLYLTVILLAFVTNYIPISTLFTTIAVPVYFLVCGNIWMAALYGAVSLIIIHKHKTNWKKIVNGTEFKVRDALFKKRS